MQTFLHCFIICTVIKRRFFCDALLPHKVCQRHIHSAHTLRRAGSNGGIELMRFALADHTADRKRGVHDLKHRNGRAVRTGHKLLTDDRLQDHRKLQTDLRLLIRRERVDNAVDRIRRAGGVQTGKQ